MSRRRAALFGVDGGRPAPSASPLSPAPPRQLPMLRGASPSPAPSNTAAPPPLPTTCGHERLRCSCEMGGDAGDVEKLRGALCPSASASEGIPRKGLTLPYICASAAAASPSASTLIDTVRWRRDRRRWCSLPNGVTHPSAGANDAAAPSSPSPATVRLCVWALCSRSANRDGEAEAEERGVCCCRFC